MGDYLLLVDDDDAFHLLSRLALDDLGFRGQVVDAHDGREACELIEQRGRPLLVLLDLRMPRMDGREVLATIEAGRLGPAPAVVIVSSSLRDEDRALADRFDFVEAYVPKPLDAAGLAPLLSARPGLGAHFEAVAASG